MEKNGNVGYCHGIIVGEVVVKGVICSSSTAGPYACGQQQQRIFLAAHAAEMVIDFNVRIAY